MSAQTKPDIEKLVRDIISGEQQSTVIDGYHGHKIIELLKQEGFKKARMYSTCSKANFEARVADSRRNLEVTVTQAHFMGSFTEINVCTAD